MTRTPTLAWVEELKFPIIPRRKGPPDAVPTQNPQLGWHKLGALWCPWEQGHLARGPAPDLR